MLEFRDAFRTEDDCKEYISNLKWPNGFRCPKCQSKDYWKTRRDQYFCHHCKRQTSVIVGTLFEGTHKPLRLWFEAIWYVTNQKYGVSALGLQKVLGIGSYQTTWNWLHKLRRAMVRQGRDRLSGITEVDEILIGGVTPGGKRGRGAENKTLVLVVAEKIGKGTGRIRLRCIPDASAKSLEKALLEMVNPGTEVHTDGWRGYNGLKKLGYVHKIIRENEDVGENLLPLANRVASLVKRWILGTHQGSVSFSHLEYYLDEYTFRFNRRTSKSRGLLFYRLMEQAISLGPVHESQLKSKKSERKKTTRVN